MYARYIDYDESLKKFTYDKNKIKVHDMDDEDILLQKNIFSGKIIYPTVYPLIFDKMNNANAEQSVRSLEYYQNVINNPELLNELSESLLEYYWRGLADMFMAIEMDLLNEQEIKIVYDVVKLLDDNYMTFYINGLEMSTHPSLINTVVRYIPEDKLELDDLVLKSKIIKNELNMYVVFVNFDDLSYHNFENILHMDNYLHDKIKNDKLVIKSVNNKVGGLDIHLFELERTKITDILLKLNDLDLYVTPMNKMTRGGKRFIFSSKSLSDKVYDCFNDHINTICNGFELVNHVFRYNRFVANDKKFEKHHDTPYYDASKKWFSKYTLLIYLTSNDDKNHTILDFENEVQIKDIRPLTCVLFNQKYEHTGYSFLNSDKIFIRTELIFHDKRCGYHPEVAKIFNSACYLTTQKMFRDELGKISSELFNLATKRRYQIMDEYVPTYIFKKSDHCLNFLTDGNDYWFLCDPSVEKIYYLKSVALTILVDYFNGQNNDILKTVKGLGYEMSIVRDLKIKNDQDAYNFLKNNVDTNNHMDILRDTIKYNKWVPKLPQRRYYYCVCGLDRNEDSTEDRMYRMSKERVGEEKRMYNKYVDNKNNGVKYLQNKSSAIILFGELHINIDDITVDDTAIYFKKTGSMASINFASCQCSSEEMDDYFADHNKKVDNDGQLFNLPPIYYNMSEFGIHLTIDMFNNNFVHKEKKKIVTLEVDFTK